VQVFDQHEAPTSPLHRAQVAALAFELQEAPGNPDAASRLVEAKG